MLRWLTLLAFCLMPLLASAEVAIPPLQQRVTDLTATLSSEQQADLEARLAGFEAKKGSQIAILIVPTTQPEDIAQYSIRVVEAWKLGRKGVDDGVLVLLAKDDRKSRIEVGYGLEGALPDAIAKRIVSDVMRPYFKQGDFYGGLLAGINKIVAVIDGEPLPPQAQAESHEGYGLGIIAAVMWVAVILGGFLQALLGRFVSGMVSGGLVTALLLFLGAGPIAVILGVITFFWTLAAGGINISQLGKGSYGGRGSFGGGGLGGGGFFGGGGGFGGGGASGGW